MTIEQVLALVDEVIYDRTGKHLNDLQATVLREVWQGKKYLEIADTYGCTEGHAKDAGYLLWKNLSSVWGEKVNKSNFKTAIKKRLRLVKSQLKSITTKVPESKIEPQKDISFIGRESAISDLNDLSSQNFKIVVIQGQGGIGKTTLAKKYLARQDFEIVLEFLMAKETQNITSVESLVEEWLIRDFQEEPGKEFGVTLARLKRHLEKQKVGILIDNLEPALNKNGRLITEQRNYIELLRILADSNVQSFTLITSRDRFCESEIALCHYRLSGLSLANWSSFFAANQVLIVGFIVKEMHHIYGGNAKAMGILCGAIKEDFAADITTYWQENHRDPLTEIDLKNLVTNQFERLQKLDNRAYLLLCRLGCYHYRDIPQIDKSGLFCLLWDVKESEKKRVIESLRNRSLIEFDRGKYWLHPVIKAEALSRLTDTEWQQTNRCIARFYTESITQINNVRDGLIALEAYYHYFAIADYNAAGKVILYSRLNQWGQYLTLGTNLYRLGLSQPLLTAIIQIIDRIEEPKVRSELNNILGDLHWIRGDIKLAIDYQESTIKVATNYLEQITATSDEGQNIYYWKMLQVDSLLSIGLYQIDLWQLAEAKVFFQQVITIARNTQHHSWAEKALICSALVDSYLGNTESATEIIKQFIKLVNEDEERTYNTGRFAYFLQILGQTSINLKQYEIAENILQKAIAFSQESHYIQIKAKAIIGLAVIQRENGNLNFANNYHLEAIELLENIGAKCDLAEAYYQYALTLKELERFAESKIYLSKAIDLFEQIEAPQQVAKIKRAILPKARHFADTKWRMAIEN